jgi:hypothetical protein
VEYVRQSKQQNRMLLYFFCLQIVYNVRHRSILDSLGIFLLYFENRIQNRIFRLSAPSTSLACHGFLPIYYLRIKNCNETECYHVCAKTADKALRKKASYFSLAVNNQALDGSPRELAAMYTPRNRSAGC